MPLTKVNLLTASLTGWDFSKINLLTTRVSLFRDRLLDKAPLLISQEMSSKGFSNRTNLPKGIFTILMVINLRELSSRESGTVKEPIATFLEIFIQGILRQVKNMVWARWCSLMEMYMKGFGRMVRNMEEADTVG